MSPPADNVGFCALCLAAAARASPERQPQSTENLTLPGSLPAVRGTPLKLSARDPSCRTNQNLPGGDHSQRKSCAFPQFCEPHCTWVSQASTQPLSPSGSPGAHAS